MQYFFNRGHDFIIQGTNFTFHKLRMLQQPTRECTNFHFLSTPQGEGDHKPAMHICLSTVHTCHYTKNIYEVLDQQMNNNMLNDKLSTMQLHEHELHP